MKPSDLSESHQYPCGIPTQGRSPGKPGWTFLSQQHSWPSLRHGIRWSLTGRAASTNPEREKFVPGPPPRNRVLVKSVGLLHRCLPRPPTWGSSPPRGFSSQMQHSLPALPAPGPVCPPSHHAGSTSLFRCKHETYIASHPE